MPEPRDPYEVVRAVLTARLPLDPRARVYVSALVAWLGRTIANPELARYMLEGTRVLRDYLAGQLRLARISTRADPVRTADGLLAFTDGLSSHLLQDLHTPDEALAVLDEYLDRLFEPG
jgi:TetR/AcrR family transcriptional regulator, transcriptional repressor of bet genes